MPVETRTNRSRPLASVRIQWPFASDCGLASGECDQSTLSIPGTIQAVLAARLDRLEPDERSAIQSASVIGRVFWWDAVSELADPDERAKVGHALQSLVRKGLMQPDHSEIQQDAFRFSHILIRDAAYGAIPKSARAELHERFETGQVDFDEFEATKQRLTEQLDVR